MHKIRILVNSLLCGTLFAASATLIAPAAAQADNGCTPVVVIPLRGSGEQNVGPQRYGSQGWEGETLQRLLQASELQGAPILDIPDVVYPAPPINFLEISMLQDLHEVIQSAGDGSVGAAQAYVDFPRQVGCKDPLAVIVGYSQGAMAARGAAEILNKHTASFWENGPATAVILVADPLQKANSTGNSGGGSNSDGIARKLTKEFDSFYELPGLTRYSLCHSDDIVCSGRGGVEQHTNYFTDIYEQYNAGSHVTAAIAEARVAYGLGPEVTPIKDIYRAGDTVTARYSMPEGAEAGDRVLLSALASNLEQCQIGASVNNSRSYTGSTVDIFDVLKVTAAGRRITDVYELRSLTLTEESTATFEVKIEFDGAELAKAAEVSMGPLAGPNGDYGEFDANGNGTLDGAEVYPAYNRVMSGYCSAGQSGRWDASRAWSISVLKSSTNEQIFDSIDGPALQFSMLATGSGTPGGGGADLGSLGALFGSLR